MLECKQASAGGSMMAGAEGVRRLDFQPYLLRRDNARVVAAVNEEAAGFDRRQAVEGARDPVLVLDGDDAHGYAEAGLKIGFVGLIGEEGLDLPQAAFAQLEGRDDGGGFDLFERFAELQRFTPGQDRAGFPAYSHGFRPLRRSSR